MQAALTAENVHLLTVIQKTSRGIDVTVAPAGGVRTGANLTSVNVAFKEISSIY